MKRLFFILITVLFSGLVNAQDTLAAKGDHILYGIVVDGDTILVSTIEEIYILPKRKFESRRDMRKYERLVRNVKKVLPYAKLAKQKYDEVESVLLTLETEKEQKEYMKQVEEEIVDEFEDDLKKLTISQGRILLKLIDREIGETSYELLQEFRGKFSAFFWQTLARIFGHNLKSTFDAGGEDQLLNEIVLLIENGQL
ncbi:MAG: DUF4294 domain-containing protein [Bacteroidales bacterium]|nr:DUF4294 domain-containing protein [Bacteroidales bacterium]MBN2819147.1 DUF4294 domain-containing protein [Bacteroidales bacterium]